MVAYLYFGTSHKSRDRFRQCCSGMNGDLNNETTHKQEIKVDTAANIPQIRVTSRSIYKGNSAGTGKVNIVFVRCKLIVIKRRVAICCSRSICHNYKSLIYMLNKYL